MEGLRLENIERRVLEQNILLNALRLGRDVSLAKRLLHNEPLPPSSRSEHDLLPLLYRTAMSMASDSASDYTARSSRAASLTTATSAPSSISSTSSSSLSLRLRKAYKRLSLASRPRIPHGIRTTLSLPNPSLATIESGLSSRPASACSVTLPVTPPFQPLGSLSLPPALASDFPIYRLGHFSCAFETYPSSCAEDEESPELAEAKERSRLDKYLQSQRETALEQQRQFLREYSSKRQALISERETSKNGLVTLYSNRKASLKALHATALSELEPKHLSAEQELEHDLVLEQKNLDVRIKHMEGYCAGHGSSSPEGTLKREVTESNHNSLKQQRELRKRMDDLHRAKINVLRAKQAKQFELLLEKQQQELDDLHTEHENAISVDDEGFGRREEEMKQGMATQKQRLSRKWNFEEAFARWRLEEETGNKYGALPTIEWHGHDKEPGSWEGVTVFNDEDDNDEVIRLSITTTDP